MKNVLPFLILINFSCSPKDNGAIDIKKDSRQPILLATNEAPLGWERLRIYIDSTFEFESAGIGSRNLIKGEVSIIKDTIYFSTANTSSKLGPIAIIKKHQVQYSYSDSARIMDITKSRINEAEYDVIPLNELKEIIIAVFESPSLGSILGSKQYESIILKSHGAINETSFAGVDISGRKITVINEEKLKSQEISDYFGIGDWTPVKGSLRLQIYNPTVDSIFNFNLTNEKNKWVITNSVFIPE